MRNASPDPSSLAAASGLKHVLSGVERFLRLHGNEAHGGLSSYVELPHSLALRSRVQALLEAAEWVHLRREKPLRVLDLACGAGVLPCALARLGHRVLGASRDPEAIRLAEKLEGEIASNATFLRVDFDFEPQWEHRVEQILGGVPDLIAFSDPDAWREDPEILIGRLSKWLLPGGALVLCVNNSEAPALQVRRRLEEMIGARTPASSSIVTGSLDYWEGIISRFKLKLEPARAADWISWPGKSAVHCATIVYIAHRLG